MPETLAVIVPSKARPDNILALARAWHDTGTTADLWVALDAGTPSGSGYDLTREQMLDGAGITWRVVTSTVTGMAPVLNQMAMVLLLEYQFFGFMGDDHRPRTTGWDDKMVQALQEMGSGLVYGNDLLQQQALPTAVVMTRDIVSALGGMVPSGMRHLYLDNFWLALGNALGRIRYMPEVIIEHMHPLAGKADVDDVYLEAGMSGEVFTADKARFHEYVASGEFDRLVARLR